MYSIPHVQRFSTLLLLLAVLASSCTTPGTGHSAATKPAGGAPDANRHILLDFEKPDASLTWVSAAADYKPTTQAETTPATASQPAQPLNVLRRIAQRPEAGLWSMSIALTEPGEMRWTPDKTLDLGGYDVLTLPFAHLNPPADNGAATAQVSLTDADGKTVRGDAFPIKSKYDAVGFDLRAAFDNGLDISRITMIAVALKPSRPIAADAPLLVQTDTWSAATDSRVYLGSPTGASKSFYVQSRGDRIRLGSVGQYEMHIWNRAGPAVANWLDVFAPSRENRTLGQEGTGLLLLDQTGYEGLAAFRRQTGQTAPGAQLLPNLPDAAWPLNAGGGLSTLSWNVVWTSPVGAIIEGHQEVGPYDRLGEPAIAIKWRLMVYQWGQVFVNAAWTKTGEGAIAQPVSWALALDNSASQASEGPAGANTERLLADVYMATFRQGLATALPDRMQIDAPVAMISRTSPQKDTWWWAADERRHVFGAGIPSAAAGESSCMLLVNSPNALMKAGSFGQYLNPPRIVMRQGELELTYPGDLDNDGFVESYGFQAIRLANGRATFTIYPQDRPIFYPAFLFTVPAAEREAVNLKNSRLLINVDGKQFADPPVFPSGSFLLQLPYVLDRPVSVEAVLVKK